MSDTVKMTKNYGEHIATANVAKDAVAAWQEDGWKIAEPVKPAKVKNDSPDSA